MFFPCFPYCRIVEVSHRLPTLSVSFHHMFSLAFFCRGVQWLAPSSSYSFLTGALRFSYDPSLVFFRIPQGIPEVRSSKIFCDSPIVLPCFPHGYSMVFPVFPRCLRFNPLCSIANSLGMFLGVPSDFSLSISDLLAGGGLSISG